GVVGEAARLNAPIRWLDGSADPRSFARVDAPGLVLDTIKKAQDSSALVLRLYEAHGGRARARLRLGLPFRNVHRCSLLEEAAEQLRVDGDSVEIDYRPWELISLLVT